MDKGEDLRSSGEGLRGFKSHPPHQPEFNWFLRRHSFSPAVWFACWLRGFSLVLYGVLYALSMFSMKEGTEGYPPTFEARSSSLFSSRRTDNPE